MLKEEKICLRELQCRICKRKFYVTPDVEDIEDIEDIEFGCPHGCDDNGKAIRKIETVIIKESNYEKEVKKQMEEEESEIIILEGKVAERVIRWLDELNACLILRGGNSTSGESLKKKSLGEILGFCAGNEISIKISLPESKKYNRQL